MSVVIIFVFVCFVKFFVAVVVSVTERYLLLPFKIDLMSLNCYFN